jgi:hypothetical protein
MIEKNTNFSEVLIISKLFIMGTSSDNQGQLKKDQVAPIQAKNWKENMANERTFNLGVSKIILQKETYDVLSKGNQNWIRIKIGLDVVEGNFELCAFAVSAVMEGGCSASFLDNLLPVYKLTSENQDYSGRLAEVEESLNLWKQWRDGEIGDGEDAPARKYIYPISYRLTKSELNEIFNLEGREAAQIEFGVVKTMTAMIYSEVKETRNFESGEEEVFDFTYYCPPYC